jgi:hypothetical protein
MESRNKRIFEIVHFSGLGSDVLKLNLLLYKLNNFLGFGPKTTFSIKNGYNCQRKKELSHFI